MLSAPIFSISRHRLATDGDGVTTLVAFHGCPLRCKYCLNRQCFSADTFVQEITVENLIDELMIDNLYFVATGGGVTFGGGEPLLRSEFIRAFCELCPKEWNISIETSLNVPLMDLQQVAPFISRYYVDVKDMNPEIYQRYTGKGNEHVIENLRWIAGQEGMRDKVIIRLPEIPEFNNKKTIYNSEQALNAEGFTNIDCFKYVIR